MNNQPIHLDEYKLEDDHIDQIILSSIWATELAMHDIDFGRRHRGGRGAIGLFVDTEDRADAEQLLAALNVPGTDYTARWCLYESGDRRLFVLRLATPTNSMVSSAGERIALLDRAFLRARSIAITPKRDGIIDGARSITIENDREFWSAAIGRVR